MTLINLNGTPAICSEEQYATLTTLANMPNGGFATVHGYRPTSDYVKIPTVNIQFISKFSVHKVYQRKIEALQAIKFEDLVITAPKLLALDKQAQETQFLACRSLMIDSMNKSILGIGTGAHVEAHQTFYAMHSEGIKVHFKTVDGPDRRKKLVLNDDGLPTVDSIMVNFLEVGRKIIVEGEYKKVNSGEKVLMDNCINAVINKKTLQIKTLVLNPDNHDYLKIGGEVIDSSVHESACEYV